MLLIWPHLLVALASYPGSSPCQKLGREPGRSDHVPHDVLCVVLIIELLPTQSILNVIMYVAETTDRYWKAVHSYLARLKLLVWYFKYSFYCSAKFYAAMTFHSNDAGGSRLIDIDSVGYCSLSAKSLWKASADSCELCVLLACCHSERQPALWKSSSPVWAEQRGVE